MPEGASAQTTTLGTLKIRIYNTPAVQPDEQRMVRVCVCMCVLVVPWSGLKSGSLFPQMNKGLLSTIMVWLYSVLKVNKILY